MASTVTIEKRYFQALLRRGQLQPSTENSYGHQAACTGTGTVTISLEEYHDLLQKHREYQFLRAALHRGGFSQEALDELLSENLYKDNGENCDQLSETKESETISQLITQPSPARVSTSSTGFVSQIPTDCAQHSRHGGGGGGDGWFLTQPQRNHGRHRGGSRFVPSVDLTDDLTSLAQTSSAANLSRELTPPFLNNTMRTISIYGLSDKTTHKDIAAVLRGGRILDIYLRHDRQAFVSFVESGHAADFMSYAKRVGLVLNQKLVNVRWSIRQFRIPPHVARVVADAGTRNLVVRGGASRFTEETIRQDMEHIDHLVIIDVSIRNNDLFISTNSISRAMYARTCMKSRAVYKGLRVEYYPDECATSIFTEPQGARMTPGNDFKNSSPPTNRFDVLHLDGSSNHGSGDED